MIFIEWENIKSRCCASCKKLDIGGFCQHHGKDVNLLVKIDFYGSYAVIDCRYKEKV